MNIDSLIQSLCGRLLGHKWRRLTKKESMIYPHIGAADKTRICRRCSTERIVKARKTKTKEAINVSTTS